MKAIHKVYMDLTRQWKEPMIHVVQNDKYSRRIAIELKCDGKPWKPPRDAVVIIRYRKQDDFVGEYDTLPDGTPAYDIYRNVITIELAPQILTDAGYVYLSITVIQGSSELQTFQMILNIDEKIATGEGSEDYLKITNFLPQPTCASVGQYLQVKEMDTAGNVTELDTVEPPTIPENIVTCNLGGCTEDESAVPVNADTLGGESPDAYVKMSDYAHVATKEIVNDNGICASLIRMGNLVQMSVYFSKPYTSDNVLNFAAWGGFPIVSNADLEGFTPLTGKQKLAQSCYGCITSDTPINAVGIMYQADSGFVLFNDLGISQAAESINGSITYLTSDPLPTVSEEVTE